MCLTLGAIRKGMKFKNSKDQIGVDLNPVDSKKPWVEKQFGKGVFSWNGKLARKHFWYREGGVDQWLRKLVCQEIFRHMD